MTTLVKERPVASVTDTARKAAPKPVVSKLEKTKIEFVRQRLAAAEKAQTEQDFIHEIHRAFKMAHQVWHDRYMGSD